MLVAQSLDPTILPQFSQLPADLASMEGLPFSGGDTLANGVTCLIHVDAQAAELFLHSPDSLSHWKGVLPSASESKFQVEGTTVFAFQSRILRPWFMAL